MRSNIKYLRIENFGMGSVPDAALRRDKLYTLRRLKNFFIDYENGRLVVRKGYSKWNAVELPAQSTQLYHFLDIDGNEKIIAISNNRWYVVSQTVAPSMIIDEEATAHRPVLTWEKRCLFGTDTNAYWTDNYYIDTATKSFNLGIEKPTGTPSIETMSADGNVGASSNTNYVQLNKSSSKEIAIPFTVTYKIGIRQIHISLRKWEARTDISGNIRIAIYTDFGGSPSGTLADPLAVSDWFPANRVQYGLFQYTPFTFSQIFYLVPGVDYFIKIIGDQQYYDAFRNNGDTADYYIGVGIAHNPVTYKYGKIQVLNTNLPTATWQEVSDEARFYIGGLESGRTFDYIITYYNSTN